MANFSQRLMQAREGISPGEVQDRSAIASGQPLSAERLAVARFQSGRESGINQQIFNARGVGQEVNPESDIASIEAEHSRLIQELEADFNQRFAKLR